MRGRLAAAGGLARRPALLDQRPQRLTGAGDPRAELVAPEHEHVVRAVDDARGHEPPPKAEQGLARRGEARVIDYVGVRLFERRRRDDACAASWIPRPSAQSHTSAESGLSGSG